MTGTEKRIIGLVAGEGSLPLIVATVARERGDKIVALALSESVYEKLEGQVDALYLNAPGQIGRSAVLFKKEAVTHVVFIGKIPKINLLREVFKLDWVAVKELSRLTNFSDDSIQQAAGRLVERHGLTVLSQSEFLCHLFPDVGVITTKQPSAEEYADIEFGHRIAKEIARLDIGQTVIVKNQMILAVEAIEGTDKAIKRAVELAHGPVVVVKVAKLNHDPRFDTPTVGMNTLNSMVCQQGGGVLAVGAKETMIVDQDEMKAFAEKHGIVIVAV